MEVKMVSENEETKYNEKLSKNVNGGWNGVTNAVRKENEKVERYYGDKVEGENKVKNWRENVERKRRVNWGSGVSKYKEKLEREFTMEKWMKKYEEKVEWCKWKRGQSKVSK